MILLEKIGLQLPVIRKLDFSIVFFSIVMIIVMSYVTYKNFSFNNCWYLASISILFLEYLFRRS